MNAKEQLEVAVDELKADAVVANKAALKKFGMKMNDAVIPAALEELKVSIKGPYDDVLIDAVKGSIHKAIADLLEKGLA